MRGEEIRAGAAPSLPGQVRTGRFLRPPGSRLWEVVIRQTSLAPRGFQPSSGETRATAPPDQSRTLESASVLGHGTKGREATGCAGERGSDLVRSYPSRAPGFGSCTELLETSVFPSGAVVTYEMKQ